MKLILAILSLAAFGCAASAQSNAATQPKCTLTVAQAPAIRGFKLGTTVEQIKARFPSVEIGKPNEFGFLYGLVVSVASAPDAEKANFENVRFVSLNFLDGRLTSINVEYLNSASWDNIKQFVSLVNAKYGFNGEWRDNGSVFSDLGCDGFKVSVEAQGRTARLGVFDLAVDKVIRQRQTAKEEAARRAFKP